MDLLAARPNLGATHRCQGEQQIAAKRLINLALSCRPLGSVRVSTTKWKHVHYQVETRTLPSGRQPYDLVLTTETYKTNNKTSIFRLTNLREKESLTPCFSTFMPNSLPFLDVLTSFTPLIALLTFGIYLCIAKNGLNLNIT